MQLNIEFGDLVTLAATSPEIFNHIAANFHYFDAFRAPPIPVGASCGHVIEGTPEASSCAGWGMPQHLQPGVHHIGRFR